MSNNHRGQIITFYSFKGGTGRTMALANVAYILAQRQALEGGKGVLVIDWDLEAPGLHRYFRDGESGQRPGNASRDGSLDSKPGLIDLFYELNDELDRQSMPRGVHHDDSELWTPISESVARTAINNVDLQNYIIPITPDGLSLLKAGRLNAKNPNEYSERVNKFDWETLYNKSPHLIRAFAEALADRYSFILVDSRTGITDISGICTMLLPEKLVVVFTPNMQSIQGGLELIRRATDYRKESADLRPLMVFPLVSRVEANEPELRYDWRFGSPQEGTIGYQPEFERLLTDIYGKQGVKLDKYFDEIQIQHIPRYAYGEKIAVEVEKSDDKFSLRRSYQTFASKLVESRAPWEGEINEATSLEGGSTGIFYSLLARLSSRAAKRTARRMLFTGLVLLAISGVLLSYKYRIDLEQERQKSALLQQQLSDVPQMLSGKVEQVEISETSDGAQVFILLSIRNYGDSTIVQNYSIKITNVSSRSFNFKGPPVAFTEKPPAENAKGSVQPMESILSRDSQPVGKGEKVSGWLKLILPVPDTLLRQPGMRYTVSFADATKNTYETTYEIF